MSNWRPEDPELYEDVQTRWQYANANQNKSPQWRLQRMWRSSRDSARTPVQWSAGKNAGFTTADTPWFSINENYTDVNVAAQEADPESILHFYRKAVALRKQLSCVRHGIYRDHFFLNHQLYVYSMEDDKEKILVVCSFSPKTAKFRFPAGFDSATAELLLHNVKNESFQLAPYECRVYRWEK